MRVILNTGGNDYKFEGTVFEAHPQCGPHPLGKKGDPLKNIPVTFWPLWGRWNALSDEEKAKTLVRKGGCVHLEIGL